MTRKYSLPLLPMIKLTFGPSFKSRLAWHMKFRRWIDLMIPEWLLLFHGCNIKLRFSLMHLCIHFERGTEYPLQSFGRLQWMECRVGSDYHSRLRYWPRLLPPHPGSIHMVTRTTSAIGSVASFGAVVILRRTGAFRDRGLWPLSWVKDRALELVVFRFWRGWRCDVTSAVLSTSSESSSPVMWCYES